MTKLMYIALVPLILLALAMFTRASPDATQSLMGQTKASMDVSAMQRATDVKALPATEIAPENLY